jgi:NDP-sugar pyrophosphorylase family protein
MKVQLVIPMSGLGSRFASQGYRDLKPLIRVNDRPMIEWVLRMFPETPDPIFICRQDHLDTTEMSSVIESAKPEGKVVGIEGAKLGPVGALSAAFDQIDEDLPVLISYCDYYMIWDYKSFLSLVERENYDGAIPCYSGFHPHLIPKDNLYASCRVNAAQELIEIREKYSFEADKTKALHSPGVYYFKSGKLLKHYCRKLINSGETLGGEYYVSLVYNRMVADNLRIGVPDTVEYFCQWGTPRDLEDYLYWTGAISGKNI